MTCDQCEMISIQGVPCHETGCPNAWRGIKTCDACLQDFEPEYRFQRYCSGSCWNDCEGYFDHASNE